MPDANPITHCSVYPINHEKVCMYCMPGIRTQGCERWKIEGADKSTELWRPSQRCAVIQNLIQAQMSKKFRGRLSKQIWTTKV